MAVSAAAGMDAAAAGTSGAALNVSAHGCSADVAVILLQYIGLTPLHVSPAVDRHRGLLAVIQDTCDYGAGYQPDSQENEEFYRQAI